MVPFHGAVVAGDSLGLEDFRVRYASSVARNLNATQLFEEAICRREGNAAVGGALVVRTGKHTGRSPQDKFFVKEPSSESHIDWGKTNKPFDADRFAALIRRVDEYLRDKHVYLLDAHAGADPRLSACRSGWSPSGRGTTSSRTISSSRIRPPEASAFKPEFAVVDACDFLAVPEQATGTRSETFIIIDFSRKLVLIGGTRYAGEIKTSIFTVMNYLLPLRDTMSMHCSANIGKGGDTAIFFGLSGTGKTTLSASPERTLIGDDEHGWSDRGIFNFEGGCYAKTINLSAQLEPQIFRRRACSRRCSKTSSWTNARASSTSTTLRSPRTRASPIRSRRW